MSNLWYIENTNLFSIFCPHKFGEFRKDHQLREYRKGDFAIEKGEKEGFSYRVPHSLTHKDMADLVGTTRQTVTTIMNELRNEGLINFSRKKIYITDIRKLDMKGRDLLQPVL